ncbi:MAG: hypothetical protein ACFFDT_21980 [Candidatus Hodarchaeota archaeon]
MRDKHLSNQVFETVDQLGEDVGKAWCAVTCKPETVRSLCLFPWNKSAIITKYGIIYNYRSFVFGNSVKKPLPKKCLDSNKAGANEMYLFQYRPFYLKSQEKNPCDAENCGEPCCRC